MNRMFCLLVSLMLFLIPDSSRAEPSCSSSFDAAPAITIDQIPSLQQAIRYVYINCEGAIVVSIDDYELRITPPYIGWIISVVVYVPNSMCYESRHYLVYEEDQDHLDFNCYSQPLNLDSASFHILQADSYYLSNRIQEWERLRGPWYFWSYTDKAIFYDTYQTVPDHRWYQSSRSWLLPSSQDLSYDSARREVHDLFSSTHGSRLDELAVYENVQYVCSEHQGPHWFFSYLIPVQIDTQTFWVKVFAAEQRSSGQQEFDVVFDALDTELLALLSVAP